MYGAHVGPDMSVDEGDTERTAVKTYVPAYQRDIWDDHADELDMSRSEFVRSMVQAGRKGFDPRGSAVESGEDGIDGSADTEDPATPAIEATILEVLGDEPTAWDELYESIAGDIESRLEDALQDLQAANEIQYSGPEGGYVRVE